MMPRLPLLLLLTLYHTRSLYASLPITLPRQEPGTRYRQDTAGASVKIEVFLDLHCPDSLTAWSEIKKLADHYDRNTLDLVIHQYPLPYHSSAFLASQGFYLLRDFVGEEAAFRYMGDVLSQWRLYTGASTENLTTAQIKSMLSEQAIAVSMLSSRHFLGYLDHYKPQAVQAWKYGASRGVAGTPWYFINGVDVPVSAALMFEELKGIVDALIGVTYG